MDDFRTRLYKIKAFVFDVDGVLSINDELVGVDGELMRTSNVKDGCAIMYAIRRGYLFAIISGGYAPGLQLRLEKLHFHDIYLRVSLLDKEARLREFAEKHHLQMDEILYMGDDLPDLPPMRCAGIAACPADAAPEVKAVSHYISRVDGGRGCARDVIEQALRLQGEWNDSTQEF